ncbi:glycosyltransferase [Methanosphaera sp. WGK6]|uniref:glycosyltransferase n=1 Tax=Methanosphaera sp. WGK6 TaxID=1561964 RepID=UPI00084CCFF4|nr:glycosyltransferase [Methanosphaera sp. WGK6]OED29867.1 hypothetical protein NL43_06150 [Methanosphaera sp. WGK6]
MENKTYENNKYSDYNLIKESKYFDEKFYRENNPNITEDIDCIEYFLENGCEEEYPTSKYFNPAWYLKTHEDVASSNINPLLHFIKYGINQNRTYRYARIDMNSLDIEDKKSVEKYYNTIYDSDEFDIEYYLKQAVNITQDMDPIIHYILYGAKECLDPNKYFSTDEYTIHTNPNNVSLNPLYHYIKYNDMLVSDYLKTRDVNNNFDSKYSNIQSNIIIKQLKNKISIIIPIYNAYEETKECIRSVLLNTHLNYELILINDCSTDSRINELLDTLKEIPFVKIIQNKENKGFVKNVNIGIKASNGDVVLLNSDTIVTPKWLSHIILTAYSKHNIATVTPFSNSSDISIQELGFKKDTTFLNKMAYQVNKLPKEHLVSPTGNGFCLFIKRKVINEIGLFDEIFGRGYGEETDFTSRARKSGWINVRDNSVFIYHRRHASFTKEKTDELKKHNKKILQKRHPEVYDEWDAFVTSLSLRRSIENIEENITPYKNAERILYVTHLDENEKLVLDNNFHKIARNYECYVLTLTRHQEKLTLQFYNKVSKFIKIREWPVKNYRDKEYYRNFYFNLLTNLKIDLIYVKHCYEYFTPVYPNLSYFMNLKIPLELSVMYEGTFFKNHEVLNEISRKLNPINTLEKVVEEKSNVFDFTNKKIAVYTAITGNYDDLITPSVIESDFDYICFTDNPDLKSNFWEIRQMEDLDLDEIRKARHYKILPHKYLDNYDYSIWIDSNFDITGNLKHYIKKFSKKHKLLAIKHEERECLYKEAQTCIDLGKDDIEIINSQIQKYKNEGFPENYGLIASGILFRNHHDTNVINLLETWYNEVVNHSRRDQLSFNYACWKTGFKYDESNIFYFKNEYFQRYLHSKINSIDMKISNKRKDIILTAIQEKTSIIIPIYNAYEETKECIESVIKYTNMPYELILINDCSPDKRITELLDNLSKEENIKVIHNKINQGFVKNINIGFKEAKYDVLILNSDTIVTDKWLTKLKTTAYTRDDIATVTPLSNNAGAFSVPKIGEDNIIDERLGIQGTANIIEKISDDTLITTPTGNGFCMFIKRKAIDDVGCFDLLFGRGYGEENDFCMRLVNAGWINVIDISTYIYHNRSVSFGEEKRKLIEEHKSYIRNKHPSYKKLIDEFIRSEKYAKIRSDINFTLKSADVSKYNRKRILYVLHEGKGGTLYTSVDLMKHVYNDMDVYLLTAGRKQFKLFKYTSFESNKGVDDEFKGHLKQIASLNIKEKYTLAKPTIYQYAAVYFNVLKNLHIDIVHIRHMIRHSLDMPHIAHALGIPVIMSFHDFYCVCPSHNLIDDTNQYCGGHCNSSTDNDNIEQCRITMGLGAPLLKPFINTWRENMNDVFKCCSAFVTTSQSAYDIHTEFYPELKEKQFKIIEHGRDIKTPSNMDNIATIDDKVIRIVFPGNISTSKGASFIKAVKKYDVENKLEFHFLGNMDSNYCLEEIGIVHGPYKRSEFCKLVHEIKPQFIGIFSIWPETYCHTMTESLGCGIPILAMDIGALGERIKRDGGGFLISSNPKEAYTNILEIVNDSDKYNNVVKQIPSIKFKTTKEMAEEYMELYNKYLNDGV